MTHAAKSHDALARLQEMHERIGKLLDTTPEVETLISEADQLLLMADAWSLLRDISTRNLSESQRARRSGVMKRLSEAMRVA
jgi:hypothetical protein